MIMKTLGHQFSLEQEIDRQHSISSLRAGLAHEDKIVYTFNGNRCRKAKGFIKQLEKILPKVGITRVADISFLSEANYPVFQSSQTESVQPYKMGAKLRLSRQRTQS